MIFGVKIGEKNLEIPTCIFDAEMFVMKLHPISREMLVVMVTILWPAKKSHFRGFHNTNLKNISLLITEMSPTHICRPSGALMIQWLTLGIFLFCWSKAQILSTSNSICC